MIPSGGRLERVGVPVPKCVVLKKNVLVMSFIGENQVAAPKLVNANLSHADMQIAYEQCIEVSCSPCFFAHILCTKYVRQTSL